MKYFRHLSTYTSLLAGIIFCSCSETKEEVVLIKDPIYMSQIKVTNIRTGEIIENAQLYGFANVTFENGYSNFFVPSEATYVAPTSKTGFQPAITRLQFSQE